jgi:hypothetical protein
MFFKSFLVGAFLLLFSLHAAASPIPEAAYESYIKIKGSKDNEQASRDIQKIKRLDGHSIERDAGPASTCFVLMMSRKLRYFPCRAVIDGADLDLL